MINEYETAKKELDVIYNHITDGIILRPRARWYEEGEKSTKYFLSLEKSNKVRTHIRRLLRCESSTEELINPKIIQSEIKLFYSKLYERRTQKTEQEYLNFLVELNTPKLSVDDQKSCEGKLTVTEFWNALSAVQKNKTPGKDGLAQEFYVCFFKELGKLLVQTLNFSYENSELSTTQKQAVITLIHKKDEDSWVYQKLKCK